MIIFYRFIWIVFAPLIALWFLYRLWKGKEDISRFEERFGVSSLSRPSGKLVWLHGASVGEMLSILPLIEELAQNQQLNILVTSGTITSAKLMEKRLPEGVIHQYLPIDFWGAVFLFMNHWKPDVSIFVESEFWPELLYQAPNPILIGGRISDNSARKYKKFGSLVEFFISRFGIASMQSELDAKRMKSIGVKNVVVGGNLKFDAKPFVADEKQLRELKVLQTAFKNKKILVASSTHDPEEEILTDVYLKLRKQVKNLVMIIIPRHPERGERILKSLNRQGVKIVCRQSRTSKGGGQMFQPQADTDIYIANTIGEMGLWYNLADVVFIGGSLIRHGGQNPIEPLKLGVKTFCGEFMYNFKGVMQILTQHEIINQTNSLEELEQELLKVLQGYSKDVSINNKSKQDIIAVMENLGGATKYSKKLILEQL